MYRLKIVAVGCVLLAAACGAPRQVQAPQEPIPYYAAIAPGEAAMDVVRKAANIVPASRQLRWQQLELTAFLHFGINTFTDQEWGDGKERPALFDPIMLDADQWVRTCKAAGFKLAIITAKHHDGFCLWPSKYTEHSVKNSPWKAGKGDVVREVADACKRHGVGLGIYLSPWDRHSPLYGTAAYNDYFTAQLTELLTQYGTVDEVWFDGANGEGPNGKKQEYDFARWYALIRRLQPGAVIAVMGPDVRWVGTETGRGRETEWSVVPVAAQAGEAIAGGSQRDVLYKPTGDMQGDVLGGREQIAKAEALVWYPAETDVSIRPGWFHHPAENGQVKTPEELLGIYFSSVGRNGVLLLNIPPDKAGRIAKEDSLSLMAFAAMRRNLFQHNVAQGATVEASNGTGAEALTDGDHATHWTTASDRDTCAVITFTFPQPRTFDVLCLQENIAVGQRIEHFVAEHWDGAQWRNFTEGTTVGFKRLLRFDPITTGKVRLRILSSRLNPTLGEVGLYKQ